MKFRARLGALLGMAALLGVAVTNVEAAGSGSIRGLVKDGAGAPLVGAAIVVVTNAATRDGQKIVKSVITNSDGEFVARNIIPGRYRLKAEAAGFAPVILSAFVRPNKVTVFDSILLRRTDTLDDETSLNGDPKFASRAARGTIFHYDEDSTALSKPVVLAQPVSETHGFIHAFSQAQTSGPGAGIFPAADFGLSQQLSRSASVTISGQVGVGEYAPQELNVMTTANAGDRHRVSVAIGYGRFTIARHRDASSLGQVSLGVTDTWQVAGPVVIIYGLQLDKFAEGASGQSLLPRFGVAFDAAPRTRLYAGLVPGASVDVQDSGEVEGGSIVFPAPRVVAFNPEDKPIADRSYRIQIGGEQGLSDNSSVEVMAFFDTVSGHAVGLMAIPSDGTEPGTFTAADQSGRTRGMRVVYKRRLNKNFDASVGYSCGQGQFLDAGAISTPAHLFSDGFFQIVAAKIDANFVSTGTKISTVMRLSPSRAVFAIDPFQGEISTYDPNLNILVTQDLPGFGFLPGQWTAILDLRNLLDQQASISDEKQELIASRFHRVIRVGVSVRF